MAAVLFEGFEDLSLWKSPFDNLPSIVPAKTGNGIKYDPPTADKDLIHTIVPTEYQNSTFTCGFGYYIDGTPDTRKAPVIQFMADEADSIHITLLLTGTDRKLEVQNGAPSTSPILGTSTNALTVDVWNYIEITTYLHATAGNVAVRVNGEIWIDLQNIPTKIGAGSSNFDSIRIGHDSTYADTVCLYDNLYLVNGTDSFLGAIVVETLYPNSSIVSEWAGSDGDSINNYLLVNEQGVPSMTTNVYSSTPDAEEEYGLDDVTTTNNVIVGMTSVVYAKKTGGGDCTIGIPFDDQSTFPIYTLTETPQSYYSSISGVDVPSNNINAFTTGLKLLQQEI